LPSGVVDGKGLGFQGGDVPEAGQERQHPSCSAADVEDAADPGADVALQDVAHDGPPADEPPVVALELGVGPVDSGVHRYAGRS
jgi:hypothetical protein